jgi:hypothetical protein
MNLDGSNFEPENDKTRENPLIKFEAANIRDITNQALSEHLDMAADYWFALGAEDVPFGVRTLAAQVRRDPQLAEEIKALLLVLKQIKNGQLRMRKLTSATPVKTNRITPNGLAAILFATSVALREIELETLANLLEDLANRIFNDPSFAGYPVKSLLDMMGIELSPMHPNDVTKF